MRTIFLYTQFNWLILLNWRVFLFFYSFIDLKTKMSCLLDVRRILVSDLQKKNGHINIIMAHTKCINMQSNTHTQNND